MASISTLLQGSDDNDSGNDSGGEPRIITCPFDIIVDSNEQFPLTFSSINARTIDPKLKGLLHVPLIRKGLRTGDYSSPGYENGQLAIERKGKSDFFSCVGVDRARFEKQVIRLSQFETSAIVVEASWESILRGSPNSQLSPKTIFRTVLSWQQKYPTVHWHFCFSRMFAERVTFEIIRRFWMERNDPETIKRRAREAKKRV